MTIEEASSITASTARLNGRVNPNGCNTIYTFEYGLAASGTYTKVTGSAGSGTGPVSVWKDVSSLESGKMYAFRLSANNEKGNSDGGSFLYFSTAPARDPILFIHGGFSGTAQVWDSMISRFIGAGWPLDRLERLAYNTSQSNMTTANQVSYWVNVLQSASGGRKVDIIAHSMGSLSARYYLKNLGGTSKVDDFVSLAGPNHGTMTASAASGCLAVSCEEMRVGSDFLKKLNEVDETPGSVHYGTWRSGEGCDFIIIPGEGVTLAGADNRRTTACLGHSDIPKNLAVFNEVRSFVE